MSAFPRGGAATSVRVDGGSEPFTSATETGMYRDALRPVVRQFAADGSFVRISVIHG